jgi:tRNA-specific 2-thiouridylase
MAGKALIAMSGGVDSSVAALLAKNSGLTCIGVTMRLFDNDDVGEPCEKACCSLRDVEFARQAARTLGMPFYVFDFAPAFREQVIDRFVAGYEHGATPNPCIDCNRYIKYETLYHRLAQLELDYLVTGHYARVEFDKASGRWLLKRALHQDKDQSYVLYMLTQERLAHTRFPLGNLLKSEVRSIAKQRGFYNATKKDSQDICFVREGGYADFIRSYTGKDYPRGNFVNTAGEVIGEHEGIIRYTVGQRKGLGKAFGEPLYVKEIRPETNEVVLARNEDLFVREVTAEDVNLISVPYLSGSLKATAKVRYNGEAADATVEQTPDGNLRAVFETPVRAPTRGQALVVYAGDTVVGGGTII